MQLLRKSLKTGFSSTGLEWFQTQYSKSSFHGRFQIGYRPQSGNAILPLFTGPLEKVNTFLGEMYVNHKTDYYITANSISGVRRQTSELFSLHNIVIDIDAHQSSAPPCTEDFERLLWILQRDLFVESNFPEPTSIIQTGRGVQFWWAIIPVSEKCLCWYKEITETLISAIEAILSDYPDMTLFSLDKAASTNPVGYFRLPETINTSVGQAVCINSLNKILHSTHQMIQWAKSWQAEHPPEQHLQMPQDFSGKYQPSDIYILRNFRTSAFFRVQQLIQLRILRDNNPGEETRNNLCLIMYNAMLPVLGTEQTWEALLKFNEGFKAPMTEKELQQTICTSAKRNGYRYKNETIIRFLNITPEEQAAIGLYPPSKPYTPLTRMSGHPGRKAQSKALKEDRNAKIKAMAQQGIPKSRIAAQLGIARNTVSSVLCSGDRTAQKVTYI